MVGTRKKNGVRSLVVIAAVLAVCFAFADNAYATNGYFAHGYSIKNKALAGTGVAVPLDSLSASMNPAGIVFVGNRADLGVSLFNPKRNYEVKGIPSGFPGTFGLAPGKVDSDSEYFVIPALGANRTLESGKGALGISIYGHGGMNTDYPANTFGGTMPTGVNLEQLFIAPTYARKFAGSHAFGITPILAYQRFKAKGLQAFGMFSSSPADLTNNGHDSSWGYGGRIGYYGHLTPKFSIGAAYQSRIYMNEFDDYQGLFAEKGDFDIPSNWTVGIALMPIEAVTVAFDVQTIYYSEVNAVNNPLLPNLGMSLLGMDEGAGFGWEDMTVFKLGVQWQSSAEWTWRAGFSYGEQPIPDSEVLFNILAPGVVETHATFGITKKFGAKHEVDFALMRAFDKTVRGPNPLEAPGAQTIELSMNQWEFSLGYSRKY
jgi:long-chain fatty acid transport protein